MLDYETMARNNHRSGMNCSAAVYDALCCGNDTNHTEPPRPRSIDGKCGAVLAAEQYIRENGGSGKEVEEFDNRFRAKYGHLTCADLRGILGNKCNEYVGAAAGIAGSMGMVKDNDEA